jgi:hypothetical protein
MKKRNKFKLLLVQILLPFVLIWYYFLLDNKEDGIYFSISVLMEAMVITLITGGIPYFVHRYYGKKKNIKEWTE